MEWSAGKTWSGVIKHEVIKHGVINHGVIRHGVINNHATFGVGNENKWGELHFILLFLKSVTSFCQQ